MDTTGQRVPTIGLGCGFLHPKVEPCQQKVRSLSTFPARNARDLDENEERRCVPDTFGGNRKLLSTTSTRDYENV